MSEKTTSPLRMHTFPKVILSTDGTVSEKVDAVDEPLN